MNLAKHATKLLAATLVVFVAAGPTLADTSADIAALEAVDQGWVKAFNSGNADAAAAYYDAKGVLLPPNAKAVIGRAAIKGFLKKEMDGAAKAGVSFALGPKPAGGVSGDMGWQSGSYTLKDKAGKVVETGNYLSISMKKGGTWLYVRDTWGADGAPAPAPAPAAAPKK
jgi:ketosteroid isomerase-like protein